MSGVLNTTIVKLLKSGDRRGCTELVHKYQKPLLAQAVRVFGLRREEAEELVGDVLLAVVRTIHSFEFRKGESDFHVWVVTLFRNRVRDAARKQAAQGALFESFTERFGDEHEHPTPADQDVIAGIVRAYQNEMSGDGPGHSASLLAVADVLEKLESWERVLLRCRALDVPYEDIARYTGKQVHYLKVYHARVKKKLKKLMQQHYPELALNDQRQDRQDSATRLA